MNNIPIKSCEDIKVMKEGGQILAKIIKEIKPTVVAGITTAEIEKNAKRLFKKYHVRPSFLGHNGYPATICVSINEELVHGIPGKREIKNGDIVSVDIGVYHRGFHTDAAVTLGVGKIAKNDQLLIDVTREALAKGIKEARAGNHLGDISEAVQKEIEKAGFSVIRDCTGHGVGKNLWENPAIPNFGEAGSGPELAQGMVLAIEPMSSAGNYELKALPDGWTLATTDKSHTAHFEETVLITSGTAKVLTAR